jgi:hypothetical protein
MLCFGVHLVEDFVVFLIILSFICNYSWALIKGNKNDSQYFWSFFRNGIPNCNSDLVGNGDLLYTLSRNIPSLRVGTASCIVKRGQYMYM